MPVNENLRNVVKISYFIRLLSYTDDSVRRISSRGKKLIRGHSNGCEWIGNDWESLGMDWEWLRMARNGLGMVENGSKWLRMVNNGCEWMEMATDGWEWMGMVENHS